MRVFGKVDNILRRSWLAVASVVGGILGVSPSADAHPTITADQFETNAERKLLNERVDRVRSALSADEATKARGGRNFTQWYNWNNWSNGWNNWGNGG